MLIGRLKEVRNEEAEFEEILEVVRQEPRTIIPYKFVERYNRMAVDVFDDPEKQLPYGLVDQQRIYFPSTFDHDEIRYRVRQSLWEQADESPHRYFHEKNAPPKGKYAVLLGASDCIFAMKIIHCFEKVFLFEADLKWHEPMRQTLSGFEKKVEVVDKYVSDRKEDGCITLDKYFRGSYEKVDYIQADIEGGEINMLLGAKELVERSPKLALSICCYHNAHDEAQIRDFLRARGYVVRTSERYMLPFNQYPLRYPYLRRGVLYASK